MPFHTLDDANTCASQVNFFNTVEKHVEQTYVSPWEKVFKGWAETEFLHWLSVMLTHVKNLQEMCLKFVLFKFPFLIARQHSRQCISGDYCISWVAEVTHHSALCLSTHPRQAVIPSKALLVLSYCLIIIPI